MKRIISAFAALLIMCALTVPALATEAAPTGNENLKVEIVSPTAIDSVPIHDDTIEICITNQGKAVCDKLACYLTVLDVGRSQTYPVDEFGEDAYQIREVTALAPRESATISIPVRVMYVGDFRFTASVINYDTGMVTTSHALPVTMTATSHLNKTLVMSLAAIVPVVLLATTLLLTKKRGKKKA